MARIHDWGRETEEAACEWLGRDPLWRLIARNARYRVGELDLVFEETRLGRGIELVFVEVRARVADSLQDGVESVVGRKERRLRIAARHFLARYRGEACSVRFDILSWNGKAWEHVVNAL